MANKIIKVVTRAADGTIRERDLEDVNELNQTHEQIGIDDCSTDLSLRGFPVFRGLIGPIPESKTVARYESPDVFEVMTKEWTKAKRKRRRRRSTKETSSVPAPMGITSAMTVTMPNQTV